ncbi:alpha/beta hydrolase [Streptosporangium sandarakinum]|uniref:alpha/beta hydrolase n=1 Tax=Streptosporangium sandarakinum TaxID=1260955 RepID=UPI003D8B1B20
MAANATAELEAALSRITQLGRSHAAALDSSVQYMAANAWVGGGAPAFAQALAARRTALQSAFQDAAEEMARRIRQLGGQAQVPSFSTSVGMAAARPSSFSGMDVAAMGRLVADLQRAGSELIGAGQRLTAELSALCVTSPSTRQVGDAGVWAEEQVRDLRQRLAVIQQTHDIGTASQATAAFGLFGGHAPDANGVNKLTAAAARGDAMALKALADLQKTGKDKTLAGRLSVWWRQLGPLAQGQLMNVSPGLVGSLNGLPAVDRDKANRAYLAAQKSAIPPELQRLRASSAALGAEMKKLNDQMAGIRDSYQKYGLSQRLEQLRDSSERLKESIGEQELKMRQLAAVEKGMARGGQNGRAPAFLLQLELGGLGKAIVSFGDPDKADNVAVYVPGTDTKLEGFGGDDSRRVASTWDQADFFKPNKKVASIAWLGYDAPQWGTAATLDGSPAFIGAAEKGAPLLVGFVDGLHATRKLGSDVRLTVLGHSYGSTTVGTAARLRPKAFAEQLIFVGSPGVGVPKAKYLAVDSVWVGEAPNDPVSYIGSIPTLLIQEGPDGVKFFPKETAPLGVDPGDPEFGANRFYVPDSGDPAVTAKAHSRYWDDDSMAANTASLKNIAHLVNGQYDALIPFPKSSDAPTATPLPSPAAPDPLPRPLNAMPLGRPSPHPLPSPSPGGE